MNIFDRINEWLDRTEVSWVNVLTKVLPIIVPIIPAIQTKTHVVSVLGYDEWTGWVAAVIVEFFGYAAMYKMIAFAEHNRKYTDPKNKAPLTFAILIYVAYLAIIVLFNVIPEVENERPAYIVWMNALFSFLSVPAGALTAISAVHTERKEAMKRGRKPVTNEPNEQPNEQQPNGPERTNERRTNVPLPQMNEQAANEQGEQGQPFGFPTNASPGERVLQYIEQVRANEGRTPGQSEIARNVKVSKDTANTWLNKVK
jgi:uncharacterized membrane protein